MLSMIELNLSINVLTNFLVSLRSTQVAIETPKRTTKLILVKSVATLIASITLDALWQT